MVVTTEITVKDVISYLKDGLCPYGPCHFLDYLQRLPGPKERIDKLMWLLPENLCLDTFWMRELLCTLQREYGIGFGVCEFYHITGHNQFCSVDQTMVECRCGIPTSVHCVFREKTPGPQQEFSLVTAVSAILER